MAIAVVVVWVPGVNNFFQAAPPVGVSLIPNLVFGVVLLLLTEAVKYARRTHPTSKALAYITW